MSIYQKNKKKIKIYSIRHIKKWIVQSEKKTGWSARFLCDVNLMERILFTENVF